MNDGNLTMDNITVSLETTSGETVTTGVDDCSLPTMAPGESSECSVEFTPTEAMSSAAAKIFGYGPQEQEVELTVNLVFE